MKNKFFKYCIALIFACSSTAILAQSGPGSGSDNGGIDNNGSGDSTPGAPINDYVGILALVGLSYAIIKFKGSIQKLKA